MIRAVIFDIDNTLYDYDKGNAAAVKALAVYVQEHFGWTEERLVNETAKMQKILNGRMGNVAATHNRVIRYQNILEQYGLPLSPHALRMGAIYWDALIEASVPSPGAPEALKRLKEAGIRIGIGTDMTARVQLVKLEKLKLLPWIDFMVSSEEAGEEKPSPVFFDLCVRKAGCSPSECLFVGDSLKKDVLGAKAAGLQALWYVPEGEQETGGAKSLEAGPGKAEQEKADVLVHMKDLPGLVLGS